MECELVPSFIPMMPLPSSGTIPTLRSFSFSITKPTAHLIPPLPSLPLKLKLPFHPLNSPAFKIS